MSTEVGYLPVQDEMQDTQKWRVLPFGPGYRPNTPLFHAILLALFEGRISIHDAHLPAQDTTIRTVFGNEEDLERFVGLEASGLNYINTVNGSQEKKAALLLNHFEQLGSQNSR